MGIIKEPKTAVHSSDRFDLALSGGRVAGVQLNKDGSVNAFSLESPGSKKLFMSVKDGKVERVHIEHTPGDKTEIGAAENERAGKALNDLTAALAKMASGDVVRAQEEYKRSQER